MADDLKRVGLVFKADGTVDFNKSLKEVNASIKENYSAFKLAKSQWDESTSASQKLRDEQKYLSAEVKDYTDKVKMLEGELAELTEKEAQNAEKVKKKKEQLDAAKNTAEDYKKKCSAIKTELEQLEQEENANEEAIKKKKEELAKAEKGFSDYSARAEKLETEIDKLNKGEANNEAAIQKKKAQLENTQATLNNYKKSLDEVTKQIDSGSAAMEEDMKKTDEAISKVNSSIKENESAFKLAKSQWDQNTSVSQKLRDEQEYLAKQSVDYAEKVDLLTHELELLESAEEQDEKAIADKRAELNKAQENLNTYQGRLDEVHKKLQSGAAEFEAYGKKIEESGKKISEAGEKIEKVGGTLTKTVTTPIVGLATAAVKTAADFDSAMSNVQAISSASAEDMEKLRDKAREMGANTKFSATEAGDAMSYMAMAGWKTKDMLGGIEGIMNLAAASGEDLATTSDIVTDALTAFGMTAEESTKLADIMAAASSNANTNVSMLGESFKYVAPVAGAMGYKAEDVAVALGLMANSGIKASSAGTALRTLLTNMAKPTDNMEIAMTKLGISLDDGEGNMLSFAEIMEQLRAGFGDLQMPVEEFNEKMAELDQAFADGAITEGEYADQQSELMKEAYGAEGALKAQTAAMLAGKEGMSGLLAIVNSSDEDFAKLTNAINDCDGASEEMAAIMQDNLTGQLTNLKSKMEELAISIGEIMMPVIRDIVSHVQGFVDKLNAMDEGQKETIVTIGLLAAAIGPLIILFGKVVSGIGNITTGIGNVVGAVSKNAPIVQGVMSTIGTGAKALFGIIAAHPIIAIITAIIAAVILLYNKCEWFRDGVDAVIKAVIGFFSDFDEHVDAVVKAVIGFLSNCGKHIGELKETVAGKFEEIRKNVSDKIQAARDTVSEAGEKIREFLDFGNLRDSVLGKFDEIKDGIKEKIEWARDQVSGAVEKIKGFFNFEWSLPSIKLPHFSITGDFGINPPRTPHFSVQWYKEGGILQSPTLFGMNDEKLLGGGEAGKEAVLPIELLKRYIREENQENNQKLIQAFISGMREVLEEIELVPEINLYLGDRKLADLFYDLVIKKINSQQRKERRVAGA